MFSPFRMTSLISPTKSRISMGTCTIKKNSWFLLKWWIDVFNTDLDRFRDSSDEHLRIVPIEIENSVIARSTRRSRFSDDFSVWSQERKIEGSSQSRNSDLVPFTVVYCTVIQKLWKVKKRSILKTLCSTGDLWWCSEKVMTWNFLILKEVFLNVHEPGSLYWARKCTISTRKTYAQSSLLSVKKQRTNWCEEDFFLILAVYRQRILIPNRGAYCS